MAINNQQIKALKCPESRKQIKRFIGDGLFILVKDTGSKLWRFRYKYAKKHQELALGKYPSTSLADAKELAHKARVMLVQGINPAEVRKQNKRAATETDSIFLQVALNWCAQREIGWSVEYATKVKRWIEIDAKNISKLHIENIDASHITEIMTDLKAAGTPKKASPILSILNRIFAYAVAKKLTKDNPAQNIPLRDIIGPLSRVKHQPAITDPKSLRGLIISIDENELGDFCAREALKLLPRVFLRPIEVRSLKWEYIDFDTRQINIPADEMKKSREHTIPLASQVLAHLKEVHKHTNYSAFVFPNSRDSNKPISKNVLVNRIRSLGYDADAMSAHGFRSTASTILHEEGWDHDIIELQLAHLIGNETSRSYNRALYLPKRRMMMQFWADYLEKLKIIF
jgi:integrase